MGRCLLPHPKTELSLRPTGESAALRLESLPRINSKRYALDGEVYSDASGSHSKCPHRSRVAYSAVVMREGGMAVSAPAPLDYLLQTVVARELEASAVAARFSPSRALNHVDCEAVIKGARRGEEWCSDPTRPYADHWREWWNTHRAKSDGPECLMKVKAHTTAADIGVKIFAIDR